MRNEKLKKEILKFIETPKTREEIVKTFDLPATGMVLNSLILENKLLFKDGKFSIAPKLSKYGNVKTESDGYKFDSMKEESRYQELKLLQSAGTITELKLQPKYKICNKVFWNGKSLRERYYIADFRYIENGRIIVEDVKSEITRKNPVYTLKKQMFLLNNQDIEFREV